MTGEVILKRGRGYQLPAKATCKECPLRRDAQSGALGGWTPDMYVEALHGPADIACHMSKGFDIQNPSTMRSCTGVAAYRANAGVRASHPCSTASLAVLVTGPRLEVFSNPQEFAHHHTAKEPM